MPLKEREYASTAKYPRRSTARFSGRPPTGARTVARPVCGRAPDGAERSPRRRPRDRDRPGGGITGGRSRRARVPCLLLPRGPLAVRRVLAAIDGGPDSRDIVRAALLIGRLFDATVRSLRVEQPVLTGVGAPASSEDATLSASYGRGSV